MHDIYDNSIVDLDPPMNITEFGDRAFQVNQTLIKQPILLLSKSVYKWKVKTFDDITIDSLSLFHLVYPTIEILFIGCGERMPRQLDPEITKFFKAKGIVVEVSSTVHAASTFNVLNSEGRSVGAALLTLEDMDDEEDIE